MTTHDKMAVGSRAQVYKGLALKTSGGLTKKDILAKKDKMGNVVKYVSKLKSLAAKERMEGDDALRALFKDKQFKPKPCKPGKKPSKKTGLCPCDPPQRRSGKTGRCVSPKKPCKPHQRRSKKTGRCVNKKKPASKKDGVICNGLRNPIPACKRKGHIVPLLEAFRLDKAGRIVNRTPKKRAVKGGYNPWGEDPCQKYDKYGNCIRWKEGGVEQLM